MPILPLALPAGSNQGEAPHMGVAALINCSARAVGEGQKEQMQVWAEPGLDTLKTFSTTGGVRGMLEVDGVVKTVVGRTLFQVDSGGNALAIGGIPSDGHVGMARNQRETGTQTIIACDGLAWVEAGGSLNRITDADLPSAVDVAVVNRSAIFASANGRMYRSEIDDATSIDGLDTAVAESAPDGLLRVLDRGGDLIAIGQTSVEVWSDTGGEAFGFSRAHVVRLGLVGAKACCKASVITGAAVTDTVCWVANDQFGAYAGVVMLDGYSPRKISTLYVDRLIAAVTDKTSIVATSWVLNGQAFVAFRLPDTSLVYNTTTGMWHERQSRTEDGLPTTWRVSLATVLGGRVLVGDATLPVVYWLDPYVSTEAGSEMVMTVRTPPVHAFPGKIEMSHLYLDAVPGVGLVTGQPQDVAPVVTMRMSRDGETWSSGRDRALGRTAQSATRVEWSRMGTFAASTFEFSCSANVVRGFASARWDGRTIAP